jgi:hypothetical protein
MLSGQHHFLLKINLDHLIDRPIQSRSNVAHSFNGSLRFAMKNTPKAGLTSNFWGAVQLNARAFFKAPEKPASG